MKANEFNSIVIKYFDEIKDSYLSDKENICDGEEMGSTILIEDYLMPFIYEHLNDKSVMNRLSQLLEELISIKDDYCDEVLYCSFFEKIHYENMEDKFTPYFKENAVEFYKQLKF